MNVKFKILKGKKKYSNLLVRFWDSNRIDQTTSVGYKFKHSQWSNQRERLKITISELNADEINHKLDKLESHIVKKYNDDYNSNGIIDKTWLKDSVNGFFNRAKSDEEHKVYFLNWVRSYVENVVPKQLHNGEPISTNTIQNYNTVVGKIEAFEKHMGKRYKHEEIDLDFHRDLIHFCKTELKLGNNTIGDGIIAKIKVFCKNIEFDGLPISPLYKHEKFYTPKNETYHIYLSNDEIHKILNHDFKNSDKLDNARDLFVIAIRTGLRVSDIKMLTIENFLGDIINITMKKTKRNLSIPVHPDVKKVLKKRDGQLPRIISSQKFNKYIKVVAQECEINQKTHGAKKDKETNRNKEGYYEKWELITSHTGRRSLATNLYLDGIEPEIARRATGHKTVKQYLDYVKASVDEHVDVINKKWTEALNK
jgi:integrase